MLEYEETCEKYGKYEEICKKYGKMNRNERNFELFASK